MTNRRSLMLPAAVGSVLLTMLALIQGFAQQRWFMPSVAAVAVAFGTGWLARRLDVPGLLAPALSALAMLALLGLVFLPETTAYGFPTAATMQGIGDALGAAAADIRQMAPPAEATEALTLLATAGVFVVATIVDLLVFWMRRPVAAGLPLLALYLIPTSMAANTNIFIFVLATTGYLGILLAEGRDRARAWGRRLSGIAMPDEFADVSHVARVGRRIGSAAVGIALCVPIALPSVGDGILNGGGAMGLIGRGDGDETAYVVNPIVAIRGQLQEREARTLFTVRTPRPEYLRLTTLDLFDGNEWTIVHRKTGSDNRVGDDDDDRVPTPRELDGVELQQVDYDVEVSALAVNWLPLAYVPRVVDVGDGDWRYEDANLAVFSADRTSQNVKFRAQSLVPNPTEEQLRAPGEIPEHITQQYLQLPNVPVPDSARAVLAARTEGEPTPYDKAVALNDYFFRSGGFDYSLDGIEGNATNVLDTFLTQKSGYCEQFAAAMAYLARLAGIPARVVVGFTPGTPSSGVDQYAVSNKDAHAWPELYFPRTGWVRFEPTPRGDTSPPSYAVPPEARQDPTGEGEEPVPTAAPSSPGPKPSERPRPGQFDRAQDDPPSVDDPEQQPGAGGGGSGGGVPAAPLAGAGALALMGAPAFVGWATRRRRRAQAGDPVQRIHAAWEALGDAAEDAGFPMRAADSPRGAGRRLVTAASLTGPVADEVWRLAAAEERARYAASAPPVDGLDASARLVRTTLLGALPWPQRVRALVFPASSLRRISVFARRLSESAERRRDAAQASVARAAARVLRRGRPRAA